MYEQIDIWTKEGDKIAVIGDLNYYIYRQRVKSLFPKIGII